MLTGALKIAGTLERKQIIESKSWLLSHAKVPSNAANTPGQQVFLLLSRFVF